MKTSLLVLLLSSLSLSVRAGAAQPNPTPAETYVVECSFTNPAYTGTCGVSEETPTSVPPRKACQQILSCLNNVQCSGKTYCNATTVRGGWKLVRTARGAQACK